MNDSWVLAPFSIAPHLGMPVLVDLGDGMQCAAEVRTVGDRPDHGHGIEVGVYVFATEQTITLVFMPPRGTP